MVTLGGAKALKLEDQIGSLEPGKKPMWCCDTDRPEWRPLLNDESARVVSGRSGRAQWCDGQVVVKMER